MGGVRCQSRDVGQKGRSQEKRVSEQKKVVGQLDWMRPKHVQAPEFGPNQISIIPKL